jgi:SagB-type dehydrogenase family enzyme
MKSSRAVNSGVHLLSAPVDDPRRAELRRGSILGTYRHRGASDDLIEIGYELTKLRRTDDWDIAEALAVFQRPQIYSVEYQQDREYPLRPSLPLPPATVPDRSFSELVRCRRSSREFERRPLALAEASTLMFCALGETGRVTVGVENQESVEASLRSIPSGGALHPTHLLAVVLQQGDLGIGVYHYDAPVHALEFVDALSEPQLTALFAAFPVHPLVIDLGQAAALFFVTTKFWRARAKYGPRGYRYCLQEAGAACQNLCLAAVALGLSHVVLGGFYDDEVHALLQIDGVDHAIVTAIAVGAPSQLTPAVSPHVER